MLPVTAPLAYGDRLPPAPTFICSLARRRTRSFHDNGQLDEREPGRQVRRLQREEVQYEWAPLSAHVEGWRHPITIRQTG